MDLCTDANTPLWSLNGITADCKVVSVHDGDTLKIIVEVNGVFVKLLCRVRGIDTPEIKPPLKMPNRAECVKSAHRARNRLIQLVTDMNIDIDSMCKETTVVRALDKNEKIVKVLLGETDKYGRTLVSFPEIPVSKLMIEEGFANPYDGGTKAAFERQDILAHK